MLICMRVVWCVHPGSAQRMYVGAGTHQLVVVWVLGGVALLARIVLIDSTRAQGLVRSRTLLD